MASASKNYFDIYNWLIKVIDSCNTIEQCDSTDKLIENYYNLIFNKFMKNKIKSENTVGNYNYMFNVLRNKLTEKNKLIKRKNYIGLYENNKTI